MLTTNVLLNPWLEEIFETDVLPLNQLVTVVSVMSDDTRYTQATDNRVDGVQAYLNELQWALEPENEPYIKEVVCFIKATPEAQQVKYLFNARGFEGTHDGPLPTGIVETVEPGEGPVVETVD